LQQKFIITNDGHLRLGRVNMHKDLLKAGDVCIGGGYYEIDYTQNRLILSRESYDFGRPRWDLLHGRLKMPKAYEGMGISYRPDARHAEEMDIGEEAGIEWE
jgi:hypothetical protein